jgi:hypothetical protein
MLVEGVGFEPTKAEPSDLQSDPFDRSGTPPDKERAILPGWSPHVNGRIQVIPAMTSTYALQDAIGRTLVPPQGVEPWTFSLQVSCSTS